MSWSSASLSAGVHVGMLNFWRIRMIHGRDCLCDPGYMAQTVGVVVNASDRARLEAVAADRNQLAKHQKRAWIVLASSDGGPVQQVATRVGVSRPMV